MGTRSLPSQHRHLWKPSCRVVVDEGLSEASADAFMSRGTVQRCSPSMVPEQNYEETDRLEMLLLRQDVLSDFLLDTWKADFKTSSKWRAIPNVDPHSLMYPVFANSYNNNVDIIFADEEVPPSQRELLSLCDT